MSARTAVLLTNLGTPDRLEVPSVKRFLKEFLSDPMVVNLPRWFWLPLLNGIILPLRSPKTLEGYRRVWTDQGSPLLAISKRQREALQQALLEQAHVDLAMRYGNPSFLSVLRLLRDAAIQRIVVLPLYPQFSETTTATSEKHLRECLKNLDYAPEIQLIDNYAGEESYILALETSIRAHWKQYGQQHLLMSFHGLPQVNVDRGDPYQKQCEQTARLLAQKLGLDEGQWSVGYQSRFGKQTWIQPYTSDVLEDLISRNIKSVDIICPGFSADCLETLDEIEVEYREEFLELGGESFRYIPALNDQPLHIEMMKQLVLSKIQPTTTDEMN